MIWFALIISLAVATVVGLITRSLRRALSAGLITLVLGVAIALILVYSGLMGG